MEKKTILVVDDDKDTIELVSFTLKREGYTVLVALDMNTAMNLIHKKTPDLVILDLTLPQGSGFEICCSLKCDEKYRNIPIIILTADLDEEDELACKKMGVQEYITKPFDPDDFITRIKNILEQKKE